LPCGGQRIYLELETRRVQCRQCGAVKQERLSFLADSPWYTKRFAYYVGRRCREGTIKSVARELRLDWTTVKRLEMQYMAEQLRRAGNPAPKVIGIDEVSVRKGHDYRIVVSDLLRERAIWFGGRDRSEASTQEFYAWLGAKRCKKLRLAVMDMWEPFTTVTRNEASQATILYDKFHVMSHLGEAMDKVRRSECARVTDKDRRAFIKGQRYNLLSRRTNLTVKGRRALKLLFQINRRLNTAYMLKEAFEQLWDYQQPAWAWRFFCNWRDALKWQRLKPYERFAKMIESHWAGIAAHCQVDSNVPLGFVEGFNNKIRVIQRRGYGLPDEEYLRLKVLTCTLPEI
jgi:transposase